MNFPKIVIPMTTGLASSGNNLTTRIGKADERRDAFEPFYWKHQDTVGKALEEACVGLSAAIVANDLPTMKKHADVWVEAHKWLDELHDVMRALRYDCHLACVEAHYDGGRAATPPNRTIAEWDEHLKSQQ